MRKLLFEKFMCVNNKILIEEIMEALTIILENIFFSFGDSFWHQLRGMSMDTPIACVLATLFFAYDEIKITLPKFDKWIMFF